ncbi:protein kinase protein with adenine nucleotidealpha hydrolases-like domain, partial [Striga asiatica]
MFTCSKEGKTNELYRNKRKNVVVRTWERKRGETRCGCPTRMSYFIEQHNHPLVKVHLLRSHRGTSATKRALMQEYRETNIPTCQQVRLFGIDAGGPFGMKEVITGIRLDDHAKELLDWELVKVADSGDSVVAIHVCRNSGNPFSFAFLNPSCFSSKHPLATTSPIKIPGTILLKNQPPKVALANHLSPILGSFIPTKFNNHPTTSSTGQYRAGQPQHQIDSYGLARQTESDR